MPEDFLPVNYFLVPDTRFWYGFIISSLVIAIIYYFITRPDKSVKACFRYLFEPRVWLTKSTLVDLSLFIFNYWLKVFLVVPLFYSEYQIILWLKKQGLSWFPRYQAIELPTIAYVGIYSIVFFLVSDFSRFFIHWLMHQTKFLWNLHKVHHSATVMTPLTLYRAHPLEAIVAFLRHILVTSFVAGIFVFFFNNHLEVATIFGVQTFGFIFNFVGSNLRHSHVALSYGSTIESVFISPAMHQVHHSVDPEKNSKNFGSCLALWDILFKTYYRSDKRIKRFGLSLNQRKNYNPIKIWKI